MRRTRLRRNHGATSLPRPPSWSKGCSRRYAYYCRPGYRGVNVTKARLESLFEKELARLQPTAGYMRLLMESVLRSTPTGTGVWACNRTQVPEISEGQRSTRPSHSRSRLHSATSARSSMAAPTGAREATAMTPPSGFPSVTRMSAKPTNVVTSCAHRHPGCEQGRGRGNGGEGRGRRRR